MDISFVNKVENIQRNPKVTAINSCIEVDITGQAVSDSIGTRMYSGKLSLSGKLFCMCYSDYHACDSLELKIEICRTQTKFRFVYHNQILIIIQILFLVLSNYVLS